MSNEFENYPIPQPKEKTPKWLGDFVGGPSREPTNSELIKQDPRKDEDVVLWNKEMGVTPEGKGLHDALVEEAVVKSWERKNMLRRVGNKLVSLAEIGGVSMMNYLMFKEGVSLPIPKALGVLAMVAVYTDGLRRFVATPKRSTDKSVYRGEILPAVEDATIGQSTKNERSKPTNPESA